MQNSFPYQSQQQCIFCEQQSDAQPSDLHQMMNQALFAKHLSQLSNNYMIPIDIMLKIEQPTSANELQELITFKELAYVDQIEENMKREYRKDEFQGKAKMLSEYYKFHKDIPHVVERGVQKILAKYYDRRREFDYKCIKKKLKDEQGVSITSVEDSATENSETVQQKSRYSTLLIGLDHNDESPSTLENREKNLSDSNLLQQICKQIGKAFPKVKVTDHDFQGLFYENNRNFDNYVKQYVRNKKDGKSNKTNDFFKKRPKQVLQQQNYLNFAKKQVKLDQNDTIKNRNNSLKFKTRTLSKQKGEKNDESHKKFIYNTNIKIEIKNAMFYPHDDNHLNFGSGQTRQLNLSTAITKSRKSLVGKINTLTDDRFRTPITKIYQPQETQMASRYRKRSNSNKKQKTKNKISKDFNNFNLREEVQSRESSFQKKAVSTHVSRRETLENINENTQGKLTHNLGTISVSKLKLEHQRNGLQMRNISNTKKQSSCENLRRKSITFSQNKNSMQRIPLFKYSSSEMKDKKVKGISIKELLSKKLNICQR